MKAYRHHWTSAACCVETFHKESKVLMEREDVLRDAGNVRGRQDDGLGFLGIRLMINRVSGCLNQYRQAGSY